MKKEYGEILDVKDDQVEVADKPVLRQSLILHHALALAH